MTDEPSPNPEPTPSPAGDPAPAPAGGELPQKIDRPEGLGSQFDPFWKDDSGLDYGALAGEFDALRAAKAEQDSRLARVPETPDGYEAALPDNFELPEGMTFEVDPNDPMLPAAREYAKANDFTPDQFRGLVGLYANIQVAEHESLTTAAAAELEKLGSKGTQRVEAVTKFLEARLGNEAAASLAPMLFTAAQVTAFEKLMDLAKGGAPKFNGGGRETNSQPEITDEQYAALTPQQRIELGYKTSQAKAA